MLLLLEVTPEPIYKPKSHYFITTYRYEPKITLPSKCYLLSRDLLVGISKEIQKDNKTSHPTMCPVCQRPRQARDVHPFGSQRTHSPPLDKMTLEARSPPELCSVASRHTLSSETSSRGARDLRHSTTPQPMGRMLAGHDR